MGEKNLKFRLKNDRVERVEELSLRIGKAVNESIVRLAKGMDEIQKAQELFYDTFMARTLRGRWLRFKTWIGGKK